MRLIATILGTLLAATGVFAQDSADRVAAVNGTPITRAEVDEKLGNNLAKLQEQIFELRERQLNALIDQQLLADEAASRGITIASLVQSEVTGQVMPATSEDAAAFFEENQERLQGEFGALEESIRAYLNQQRTETRQQEFLEILRAAADVEILLECPPIFRSEVATANAPVRGASDAPVTIVEFTDFHCPFCRRVQPALDQIREKYGDQVRLIFRDFPLDNLHPQASTVAEAARCATEQGKFWEFHDKVFASDPDGSAATLDRFAQELGLDVSAFQACRASGKYTASVRASNQEGAGLGITGTPTFFINGRMLVGAQPLEAFSRIIDEELAFRAERGR